MRIAFGHPLVLIVVNTIGIILVSITDSIGNLDDEIAVASSSFLDAG